MNVLIIEDEIPAQERLKRLIKAHDSKIQIVECLDSIKASIQWLNNNTPPDLIFSDIQLADGNSFEIYEAINIKSPIIFCTAFDEYALQAFKHNSIDYLLKPIDEQELTIALKKYKEVYSKHTSLNLEGLNNLINQSNNSYKKRFMVKLGDKIKSIPIEEILYFYSQDKTTYIVDRNGAKHMIDYALDEVESIVDPENYFRLNRKYISHLDAIRDVYSYSNSRLKIKLNHCKDQDILVSREKVAKLKEWLDS